MKRRDKFPGQLTQAITRSKGSLPWKESGRMTVHAEDGRILFSLPTQDGHVSLTMGLLGLMELTKFLQLARDDLDNKIPDKSITAKILRLYGSLVGVKPQEIRLSVRQNEDGTYRAFVVPDIFYDGKAFKYMPEATANTVSQARRSLLWTIQNAAMKKHVDGELAKYDRAHGYSEPKKDKKR